MAATSCFGVLVLTIVLCPVAVTPQSGNRAVGPGPLIVTSILEEPYLMWKRQPHNASGGNREFEGFLPDMLDRLSRLANFTYTIKLVNDSSYGVPDASGQWTGMIGELLRKEADLAVAPLAITVERENVVDFTKSFMSSGITIVIKKPVKLRPGSFSFCESFGVDIWICILCGYLLLGLVLFLTNRCSPQETTVVADGSKGIVAVEEPSGWRQTCNPRASRAARSASARLARIVGWIFTIAVVATYTASLAATLTVERMSSPKMVVPIGGADDLQRQSDIAYGLVSGSYIYQFFRSSQVAVYKRMWEHMQARPEGFVANHQEGFKRVRNSLYAFLTDSSYAEYLNQQAPCNTMTVGGLLASRDFAIATQSGSPLTKRLSGAILALQQDGTLAALKEHWWMANGQCGPESAPARDAGPLALHTVAGLFYIFLVGLGCCLIMLLLECLCAGRIARSRRERDVSLS